MLNNIKEQGILIINTSKNEKELNEFLTNKDKEILKKRNIQVYTIDAGEIASSTGIKGKISKIIEMLILDKLSINNAEEILIESIRKAFKTKGENIINSNIEAVKLAMQMKELGIVVICIFALSLSAGKIQKVKLLNVTFMQKILQNIQMVLQEIILSPLETTSMD